MLLKFGTKKTIEDGGSKFWYPRIVFLNSSFLKVTIYSSISVADLNSDL